MTSIKLKLKNDKYKKSRGGYSRLLDISCSLCGNHICYYQKDGPGILKRMYLDRITGIEIPDYQLKETKKVPQLICTKCHQHLGIPTIYDPEKRAAYRLFVGSISKRVVKTK